VGGQAAPPCHATCKARTRPRTRGGRGAPRARKAGADRGRASRHGHVAKLGPRAGTPRRAAPAERARGRTGGVEAGVPRAEAGMPHRTPWPSARGRAGAPPRREEGTRRRKKGRGPGLTTHGRRAAASGEPGRAGERREVGEGGDRAGGRGEERERGLGRGKLMGGARRGEAAAVPNRTRRGRAWGAGAAGPARGPWREGERGTRPAWAGWPAGPRAKGGRWAKRGGEGGGRKEDVFSFFLKPIF
jgi:hypothetical protein